jgi:hypothetical protein
MQHELKIVSLQLASASTLGEAGEQKRLMFESYGQVVTVPFPSLQFALAPSCVLACLHFDDVLTAVVIVVGLTGAARRGLAQGEGSERRHGRRHCQVEGARSLLRRGTALVTPHVRDLHSVLTVHVRV